MFVDHYSAWDAFKADAGDLALQLAILAGAHPIISCEVLATAALLVLLRAGWQTA